MFMEWWERIRGVDRWPEVRATIESAHSFGLPTTGGSSIESPTTPVVLRKDMIFERMSVRYTSTDGVHRTKKIWLPWCPLLSALEPGDHFYVRYCPDKPERLYIRERTQGYIPIIVTIAILAVILAFSHRR
jgi:hypothetical protein